MIGVRIALSALLLSLNAGVVTAPVSQTVQARRADDFVDTIGVNTHFENLKVQRYGTDFPRVKEILRELGVRHLRDSLSKNPTVVSRVQDLHKSLGVRFLQLVGPRVDSARPWRGKLAPEKIPGELAALKTLYGDANEAIEGPNEYDGTRINPVAPETTDADWPATLEVFTQALWKAVQADPVLRTRPVLAPSLAYASRAQQCRDVSAFVTFGNMHPYPGGHGPGVPAGRLDYDIAKTRQVSGDKPFWAGETGYHNGMLVPPHDHEPAPESVTGKYGPRLVAEYFLRGIQRAYFYELVDDWVDQTNREANFGLVHNDLTPKPIYNALKSTIALLSDAAPDGSGGAQPFQPGGLSFDVAGDLSNIHELLLQKRDGRFYLLLWQEVDGYDVPTRRLIDVPARPVTVSLKGLRIASAVTYLPTSSGAAPVARFTQPATLHLNVPDELLIVELTPETKA